jgi:hypothetical protein
MNYKQAHHSKITNLKQCPYHKESKDTGKRNRHRYTKPTSNAARYYTRKSKLISCPGYAISHVFPGLPIARKQEDK